MTNQDKPEIEVSLRDYFAAAAMQGFMSFDSELGNMAFDRLAKDAFDCAEAMLEERARRETK